MTLTVLNFPRGQDIPGQLRKIAEQIEAGENGEVTGVGLAIESVDDFAVAALGSVDAMRLIALFTNGATLVSTSLMGDM